MTELRGLYHQREAAWTIRPWRPGCLCMTRFIQRHGRCRLMRGPRARAAGTSPCHRSQHETHHSCELHKGVHALASPGGSAHCAPALCRAVHYLCTGAHCLLSLLHSDSGVVLHDRNSRFCVHVQGAADLPVRCERYDGRVSTGGCCLSRRWPTRNRWWLVCLRHIFWGLSCGHRPPPLPPPPFLSGTAQTVHCLCSGSSSFAAHVRLASACDGFIWRATGASALYSSASIAQAHGCLLFLKTRGGASEVHSLPQH